MDINIHTSPGRVTDLYLLCVHRDQVYLVSLRESYRNEIIPYRVRFSPRAALWRAPAENTEPFIMKLDSL